MRNISAKPMGKLLQKLFLLGVAFLLTSCIEVENFGDYWDKAQLDPALAGHWKTKWETDKNGNKSRNEIIYFIQGASFQELDFECKMEKQRKRCEAGNPTYPVKTIAIGPYQFVASGSDMTRYKATASSLIAYDLNVEPAWAFLESHYPDMTNITKEEIAAGRGNKTYALKIKVIDDKVAEMLASIPDNAIYWKRTGKLTR